MARYIGQTSALASATRTTSRSSAKPSQILLLVGLIIGVAAVATGLFYAFNRSNKSVAENFNPKTYRYVVKREVTSNTLRCYLDDKEIKPEEVAPKGEIDRLTNGGGVDAEFVITYTGVEWEKSQIGLAKYDRPEQDGDNSKRRREATRTVSQIKDTMQRIGQGHIRWPYVVVVDNSSGIPSWLDKQVRQKFEELNINKKIQHGDPVDVSFYRLAEHHYSEATQRVSIEEGDSEATSKLTAVSDHLDWSLADKMSKGRSLVAKGLGLVFEQVGDRKATIVIFSDLKENSDIFSLENGGYKNLVGKNRDKSYEDYVAKIEAAYPNYKGLDLTGKRILLIRPLSDVSGIDESFWLWSKYLTSKGAQVQIIQGNKAVF